jgi:pilus assembly protein CpaB
VKLSQRRLARPSLGGLLATRQGSLTLALLCAACAAGILMFALNNYKANLRAPTPQATVLVATGEIAKGTTGQTVASEGLYKSTPVLATQVVPGALSDAGELTGMTAQSDILPGEQLTTADFSAVSGVTGLLSPTQRAVSVSIDEAHGDTDVLQAGDRVDVYATFAVSQKNSTLQGNEMVLLVRNALVLKPASSTAVREGGTSVTGASLVLAVSMQQAPEVGYAMDNGKLYLALAPSNPSVTPKTLVTVAGIIQATTGAIGSGAIILNTGTQP